jgi:dihydroflavonol-4-reductase
MLAARQITRLHSKRTRPVMRVLITGGTGFVGSHTAAAVVRAGHSVRLLVRRPDRVSPALAPLGIDEADAVTGDVLDAASVKAAVEGCDAIVNAAAVYSLDPGKAKKALATNARATEIVLASAAEAGLDPIVHVSSYVALLPSQAILGPNSPIGVGGPTYPRSKAESERVARRHQAEGAPVVTTYPGAVAGPHDPYFGDSAFTLAMILRNRTPFALPGGWPVADVRYVASAHAAMLDPGRGPRRYLLGGHYRTWSELYALLRHLTGRRLPAVPTPGSLARASGRAMDGLQRLTPARLPFGHQGAWIVTRCVGTDDTASRQELGIEPPPLEQTLADSIHWMVQAGHLPPRLAGDLAAADVAPPDRVS